MDFDSMSDNEIRQRVIAMGKNIGPVNGTNRALYIKMLSGNLSGKKSPRNKTPTRAPSPKKSPSSSPRPSVVPRSVSPRRMSPRKIFESSNNSNIFNDDSFDDFSGYSISRGRPSESSVTSSSSRRSRVVPVPEKPRTYASDSFTKKTPERRAHAEEIIKKYTPDLKAFLDDDDDGKYTSRRPGTRSYDQTPINSRYSAATRNFTTPEELRELKSKKLIKPPQSANVIAIGFLVVMAAIIFYYAYFHRIKEGVNDVSNFFILLFALGYKYAVIPIVVALTIALIGYLLYYAYKSHQARSEKYQKELKELIVEMLRFIRRAGNDGLPIKQLRDKMMPGYSRTPAQLNLWNEAESFIKHQDTRVRTEERLINDADIAEFFVWSAPFTDDYE